MRSLPTTSPTFFRAPTWPRSMGIVGISCCAVLHLTLTSRPPRAGGRGLGRMYVGEGGKGPRPCLRWFYAA